MLRNLTQITAVLTVLGVAINVGAQEQTGAFVLLPIYTTQAVGAYGSRWETAFTVRNDSANTIAFTSLSCLLFECYGMTELQPATSTQHDPTLGAYPSFEGRTVYFDRSDLSGISFSLRVRDISRSAQSAGTELPVVREDALRAHIALIDIPSEPGFRHSLRIYDVTHGAAVRVRIFPFQGDQALVDQNVMLLQPENPLTAPAQIGLHGLTSLFPALNGIPRLRIEIDALSLTQRLWGFVSITNNETQEFTTVTPQ